MEDICNKLLEKVIEYGPKAVGAVVVLIAGLYLIRILKKMIEKWLERGRLDDSLKSFINAASGFGLKIILIITVAALLGIPMTTFIAVLSAAGLAIGLALKDSLSNFAGGILILSFRPFNVGDFIEAAGYQGSVKSIQLLYTYLNSPDNKRIVIPNGEMSNAKIINFSAEPKRRVDMVFGISYEDDIVKAKEVLTSMVYEHPLILKEPEPLVRVLEYASSSVNFAVRVWCLKENCLTVNFDINEKVKTVFDQEGITIPYQKLDIHLEKIIKND